MTPAFCLTFCDQEHLNLPLDTGAGAMEAGFWSNPGGGFSRGIREADKPDMVFRRLKASHLTRLAKPIHEDVYHPPAPQRLRGEALRQEYIATFVEVLGRRWPDLHRGLVSELGLEGIARELASKLHGECVPVVLLGELPKSSGRQGDLLTALRGLVHFLDGLPLQDAPPAHGRIILCLSVVEPLTEPWGLTGLAQTHVIELGDLDHLSSDDVAVWHSLHGAKLNICEQKLMRRFEQECEPIRPLGWLDRLRSKLSGQTPSRRDVRLARFAELVASPECQKS